MIPQVQFLDKVVFLPVVVVQPVEIPQVQFLDEVVFMPVVVVQPVEIPQVHLLDKVSCPLCATTGPVAGSFLSCSTSSSTLFGQGVLRAAQGLQTFRLVVPIHMLMIASRIIPVVFGYREYDLGCVGLLFSAFMECRWWCPAGVLIVFGLRRTFPCPDTADVSVDTALVSVDTSLVSENTVLVL